MATGKKFYWIKLSKEFVNGDVIDFLLSNENGAEYVVLYLKLCLLAINTGGKLEQQIGEIIVPIDIDKIQRDCKFFSRDTIIVAIELYKKLGLVYYDENGILNIANYEELIGHKTDYAIQKSLQRAAKNQALEQIEGDVVDIVEDKGVDNVHTEIRDKSLKSLKSLKDLETKKRKTKKKKSNYQPSADCLKVIELYKSICISFSKIHAMSDKRYKAIEKLLEKFSVADFVTVFNNAEASDFLKGHNDRGWKPSFDWMISENNFVKILDNNYANRTGKLSFSQNRDAVAKANFLAKGD
jgi:hypothetical protein